MLRLLASLVPQVSSQYHIDERRRYLTGLSMGGFGAFHLAAQNPELWAAVVPICGGGSIADVARLKALPMWIFHGEKDTVVPAECSVRMFNALRHAGSNVQLTIYAGLEHDSWTTTYDNPELYQWLLRQEQGGRSSR